MINVFLFILITISYFFVLKAVIAIPFYIVGLLLGILHAIFKKKEISPHGYFIFTRIENIFYISATIILIVCSFIYSLFELTWFQIWKSPLLLGLVFLGSVVMVSLQKLDNPIIKKIGRMQSFAVWLILILLLIGTFSPQIISTETFKWAATLSCLLFFLCAIFSSRTLPRNIEKYEELEERNNLLRESLKKIQKLVNLIGDSVNRDTIQKAIEHVSLCSSKSIQALQNEKYQEAITFIFQAEMETTRVENIFQDRIRFSLKDEIKARLRQAFIDIEDLEKEFEEAQLDVKTLNRLSEQHNTLQEELDKIDLSNDKFLEGLKPFESLFREIVETRTAFRFKQNFGSAIDEMFKELNESSLLIQKAQHFGIQGDDIIKQKEDISYTLQKFQTEHFHALEELVNNYNLVQEKLASFRASLNMIEGKIERDWELNILNDDKIYVYMPKILSTSETSRGIVYIKFDKPNTIKIDVALSGTLLDIQSDPNIELLFNKTTFAINHFTFAGKKGGRATLNLNFKNPKDSNFQTSFDIRVKKSMREIAQNAFIFATPIGGLATLAMFLFGMDIKEATPICVAFGGIIGLIIFFVGYMRNRR